MLNVLSSAVLSVASFWGLPSRGRGRCCAWGRGSAGRVAAGLLLTGLLAVAGGEMSAQTVAGTILAPPQKLTSPDANAEFGVSVSLSGNGSTAIVGGSKDNNYTGAAWVYTLIDGTWTLQQKLTSPDPGPNVQFGYSVSLSEDGNTAIVGAPEDNTDDGAAWVYTRSGGTWTMQQKFTSPSPGLGILFGTSVSLSEDGSTAIVGGPEDNMLAGATWVYTRSGSTWTMQQELTSPDSGAQFGTSVSLSGNGNTAIVGGPQDNMSNGAAWVYTRSGGIWTLQQMLSTADVDAEFGFSVGLSEDGTTAIVGGPGDDISGGAWVYTHSGATWTLQKKFSTTDANAYFGVSVSLSGNGSTAMVGGFGDDAFAGAAWVYTRSGGTWTLKQKLSSPDPDAEFGGSVSLSGTGTAAIIGGSGDNDNTGAAWVYGLGVTGEIPAVN